MEFGSQLPALLLFCLAAVILISLAFAACNKSVENNAVAKESNVNDVESPNEVLGRLPECAKRNKDGTYKYGHACSADQWVEWQKEQQ